MVFIQKWPFFQLFFLRNIGQENVFYDILEEKKAFLRYKNKKFLSRKIDFSPKGLTLFFGPKMAIFPSLFLGNIGQENVFYDILERKNAFLGCKNKKFKKSKNCHFSKEGYPMLLIQKWPYFQLFFLGNISKEKFFYDILERQNATLGYKNKTFKKSKNWHFSKGVTPWFWSKNDHFCKIFFKQYRAGKCLLRYSRTRKTPF